MATFVHALQYPRDQLVSRRRRLVGVGDAQAAADVHVLQDHTRGFDLFNQVKQTIQRVDVGRDVHDLRADVAINAHNFDAGQGSGPRVGGHCVAMGHAKFVALQAGGNVGVGACINIRVHTQADFGTLAHAAGNQRQGIQFCDAFYVETAHARGQGLAHFGLGFAHAREHNFLGRHTHRQGTFELTPRDDVQPTTGVDKSLQDRKVGVGFHGVTNEMTTTVQRTLVVRQGTQHGRAGVNVQRRAELLCQLCQ